MTNLFTTQTTPIRRAAQQVTLQGPGKYLLDPKGQIIFVCALGENRTHDDWALENQGVNIEDLLELGWIRIQYVFPEYLLVDSAREPTGEQRIALGGFIWDEESRKREFRRVVSEVGGVEVEVGSVLGYSGSEHISVDLSLNQPNT